jgi:hypothetical protein
MLLVVELHRSVFWSVNPRIDCRMPYPPPICILKPPSASDFNSTGYGQGLMGTKRMSAYV